MIIQITLFPGHIWIEENGVSVETIPKCDPQSLWDAILWVRKTYDLNSFSVADARTDPNRCQNQD